MQGCKSTLIAVAALASACGSEPVVRHVQFTAEDGWPRAQTWFVGEELRVEVSRIEPLQPTSAINVWFVTPEGGTIRAGVVSPGRAAGFSRTAMSVEWAGIRSVVLTEEPTGEVPAVPSTRTLFHGTIGQALTPAIDGAMTAVAATAVITDGTLTLTSTNLPTASARVFFGVWLVGSSADAGRGPCFIGRVLGRGSNTFANLGLPAVGQQVVVTVELEAGVDTPAMSSVVLRGVIPTSGTAPGAAAVEDPGHGGHVH